jgi:hypothetical protein
MKDTIKFLLAHWWFVIRLGIHWLMKQINQLIGYKLWLKGKEPEVNKEAWRGEAICENCQADIHKKCWNCGDEVWFMKNISARRK